MKKYIIVLFVSLFLTPNFVMAQEAVVVTGTITRIFNYEGHSGTLITITGMNASSGFCDRNDYYILPIGHRYDKQNYALLLSAKMANRPVSIMVSSGSCVDDLPRINHIYLE